MPAGDHEELGPLPGGHHGFSRGAVVHSQRERMIAALAEVVNEKGYPAATVSDITAAARVSKRSFYQQFGGKEECFLAAFDVVVEHLHDVIDEATAPIPDWPHKVPAGLRALLTFFVEEPELAHLCLSDALTAGPRVAKRYRETIFGFVPLLKEGRAERKGSRPALPEMTEDTVLGSVASEITRKVAAGETAELEQLVPDFTAFILRPYIGDEEAERVAAESGPKP